MNRLCQSHRLLPLFFLLSGAVNVRSRASGSPFVVSSGLQNLGNTCYLNAQLQCAFHIPRVRSLITNPPPPPALLATQDGDDQQDDKENNGTQQQQQQHSLALQALQQLFSEMEHSSESGRRQAVAPRQLCSILGIPVLQQQDSQEFWKLLLPALKLPQLTDLYQGAYEDYIVALDGSGRERRREEAFLDLSLDVVVASTANGGGGGNVGTVQKSMALLFGEPELLSEAEGNGWRPEKGAPKVDAHKGTLLRSQGLPSILQLHLKRFNFDWTTEQTSKINEPMAFPEVLDLSTICKDTVVQDKDDGDSVLYDLQAVLIHAGEYGSGHYYAYVRPDVKSDVWYRFNDDVVEEVDLKDVLCDGYGGRLTVDRPESKGGFLSRFMRVFQPSQLSTYGYGGSTSNAYVLQYVRRSDIQSLYRYDDMRTNI